MKFLSLGSGTFLIVAGVISPVRRYNAGPGGRWGLFFFVRL